MYLLSIKNPEKISGFFVEKLGVILVSGSKRFYMVIHIFFNNF